ncbi:MAG: hypothetical protein RIT44_627 [Pseudomonadota bacterium]|jgi:hypothetical protein
MVTPAPQLIQTQSPAPGQSVSVWKEFSETARGYLFRKTWQSQPGPAAKAWLSWAHHEHLLLTLLAHREAKHVVQVAGLQVHADHVEVVTVDAGLDFQRDWLDRVALQGESLFLQPTEALKLARACLRGLLSIHKIDMMHGDIKSDNLCINAKVTGNVNCNVKGNSTGNNTDTATRLVLDLDSLRWIDFAYAVCREQALKFVLPTDPDRLAYLPDQFRMAIRTAQTTGEPVHIQRAACAQVDLYSLWCMLTRAVAVPTADAGWAVWREWLWACKKLATGPFTGSAAFEAPTQQLLSEVERKLAQLHVPPAQWGEAITALRPETGVVPVTPLLHVGQTPLLTPLVPPMVFPLQPVPEKGRVPAAETAANQTTDQASEQAVEQATEQAPEQTADAPLQALAATEIADMSVGQPKTKTLASILASVGQSRLVMQRGGLGIAALAILFAWIDRRFVQMDLKLTDLGFALGLLAMVLAIPALMGSVWHAITRSPRAQAWARYAGLVLCGIAGYFVMVLFAAGTPGLHIAGVLLVLTLPFVALLF